MHTALILAAVVLATTPGHAAASDFWDDLRHPGRAAARGLARRARMALSDDDTAAALRLARRGLGHTDTYAPLHVVHGRALTAIARHDEATEAYANALAVAPDALDDLDTGRTAMESALAAGRLEIASAILARLVQRARRPAQRQTLLTLQGDVYLARGPAFLQRALGAYQHALGEPSAPVRDLRLRLGLALALHRDGQARSARELLQQMARTGRIEETVMAWALPMPERQARMAVLLEAIGDRVGARRRWEQVLATGPWGDVARGAAAGSDAAATERPAP